jgi:Zn-dependent protease with chaperone function
MDFFAKQDRARASTTKLVVLFLLGVLAIVIVLNLVAAGVTYAINPEDVAKSQKYLTTAYHDPAIAQQLGKPRPTFFEVFTRYPQVFLITTAAVIGVISLGSLYKWAQLSKGGLAVAEMLGGRVLNPASATPAEKTLLNIVEEMSLASGVPVPVVVVMDHEQSVNAFAAGITHNDAVIGVTRGCLETLSRDQLQGVIAHEYSHILNYDSALNIRLIAMLHGLMVLVIIGWIVMRTMPRSRGSNNKNAGGAIVAMLVVAVACVVVGYIGMFVGKLIQAAVSRQREFLADASAVQFTRNPRGLIGAFLRIQGASASPALQNASSAETAHMMFSQLSSMNFGGLLATHPPLDTRIRAIDPQFNLESYKTELSAPAIAAKPNQRSSIPPAIPPAPSAQPGRSARPAIAAFAPSQVVQSAGTVRIPAQSYPEPSAEPSPHTDSPESAALHPDLVDAAEEPFTARCVVLAAVRALSPRTDTRADQILARSVDAPTQKLITRYTALLRQSGPHTHLLHHAAPALRQLTASQAQDFLKLLSAVISADQSISLAEYCAYRIIEHYLPGAPDLGSRTIRFVSISAVKDSIHIALSSLAATTKDPANIAPALAAGLKSLDLPISPPHTQINVATLDKALTELASCSPPVKRRIIEAAATTILADHQVSPAETEQLRAFCAVLGVPVPTLAA